MLRRHIRFLQYNSGAWKGPIPKSYSSYSTSSVSQQRNVKQGDPLPQPQQQLRSHNNASYEQLVQDAWSRSSPATSSATEPSSPISDAFAGARSHDHRVVPGGATEPEVRESVNDDRGFFDNKNDNNKTTENNDEDDPFSLPDDTKMELLDHNGLEVTAPEVLSKVVPDVTKLLHEAMAESFTAGMHKYGLVKLTPVQAIALPLLHQGKNMIITAPTASGKTVLYCLHAMAAVSRCERWAKRVLGDDAALQTSEFDEFKSSIMCKKCGLSMARVKICRETGGLHPPVPDSVLAKVSMHNLMNDEPTATPLVIIVVPTRELVYQVRNTLRHLGGKHLRVGWMFGNASDYERADQTRSIRGTVDVIVSTAVCLYRAVEKKNVLTAQVVSYIVDEVDGLVETTYVDALGPILSRARSTNVQRVLFSATMPKEAKRVMETYMGKKNYLCLAPKGLSTSYTVRRGVKHHIHMCSPTQRPNVIMNLMHNTFGPNDRVVIFCNSVKTATWLAVELKVLLQKVEVVCLHHNRTHAGRDQALKLFQRKTARVMVATSVASRGVDFIDVDVVLNFDLPNTIEEFVHRAGRTGRHGRRNCSTHSLFIPEDAHLARPLLRYFKECEDRPVLPERFYQLASETLAGRLAREIKVVAPGHRAVADRQRFRHRHEKSPFGREVPEYGSGAMEGSSRQVSTIQQSDIINGVRNVRRRRNIDPARARKRPSKLQ
eukprot:PhM_4_TR12719/c0_g3_i1/m.67278/K13982/DDX4, VASA; probable ATP-dependent RNA helicase DDX4